MTINIKERKSKRTASSFLRPILRSRLFLQNFLLLISILFVLFLLFSLATYYQSTEIIEKEFVHSSQEHLSTNAQMVDSYLMDMQYIAATIQNDSLVQAFFSYGNPSQLYFDPYTKLQNLLENYVNSYASIDSIYLYSDLTKKVITNTSHMALVNFRDNNWIERLDDTSGDFQVFFRPKNEYYPFLLCIMRCLEINGNRAAIIININLADQSLLAMVNKTKNQEIFLISDDGQIVFRRRQQEVTEPLDTVAALSHYLAEDPPFSVLVDDGSDPYVFSQIHSSSYPWSYVMITHLKDYTAQLTSNRALLFSLLGILFVLIFLISFFFSMRSVKPIQKLINLLSDPQSAMTEGTYSSTEIRDIASQITSYVQQNQALSHELAVQLNVLNEAKLLALQSQINPHFMFNTLNMIHIQESEALGYTHPIPRITLQLCKLLRYALESTDLVTLATEIEYTKMYIDIMQERYDQKPKVIYNIQNSSLQAKVPKLFIQPIIENAIFHGLAEEMNEGSTLTLSVISEHGMCKIIVEDNGVGMDDNTLHNLRNILDTSLTQRGSIGLKNIITRMQLLYGDAFSIDIDSRIGVGSTFTLRFPYIQ